VPGKLCALIVAAALTACTARAVGPLPAQLQRSQALSSSATFSRGSIVWLRYVTSFNAEALSGAHTAGLLGTAEQVVTALGGAPKCGVALYAIKYVTLGVHNEAATASAAFFVPMKRCRGPFTLVGYGQGTNAVKEQKITDPTSVNIQPAILAAIFAAHGYATVATDYLGLGYSDYSFQPYLVVKAEASAVIDAMRAARRATARLGVTLNGKIFLTGHSQGGQTALGTQKTIEAASASEFDLLADSPSSGPYALTQTAIDGVSHPGQGAILDATYMVTAYDKTYDNIYRDARAVFRYPYATYVNDLLPVATYAQANALSGKTLPLTLTALFRAAFLRSIVHDATSGERVDVRMNDLLDGWVPKAPLYLCGGSKDPAVPFENSLLAYRYFEDEGAPVHLLDVNPYMPASITRGEYHDAVLVLCHTLERVAILDAEAARVRAGVWPKNLRGPIGPFTYRQPPVPWR
jgi:pimeloyl-ACP methyl ester carboxylesterase